ncbi:CDP-diacylglycerol--glycerol-3-phosphate 3-phosphatidyltransferase [Flaviflexus salsibiostraticola]|uniref:CDP-diacylglycerol--glycerol-3-phosphate 3-phosphatidyltransferase n=1 Tax=Flaviflexus salsibiostraticola TaxID=1282737 RepID=A0A3Q8WS08_9ACTO|nr:CDP-diacylglycerol--glycerol-3-phosphate 3-phosphatidyltransferase [Flaviflexus salsibiostraticola]AZN28915.1 CDP-diacylglycerol--glycerol-3-phosphate 3-phosphatidyltransferase [Flaviflexus salsibiostraticola]
MNSQPPVLNVANAVTVVRLLLIPLFIWAFWDADPASRYLATGIFFIATLTDKLDGYLARSRNLITDFGKLADSIADKALIGAALIMLSWHDMLWWWVTIIMLAREIGITIMRMYMKKKAVMAAGKGGKLKMFLQSLFIGGLLMPWRDFLPDGLALTMEWLTWALVAAALVVSIVSAIQYVQDARRINRETN